MDAETEIRRIKRLGLNLEKLEKEIENNAADCFELVAILKKIEKIKQQLEQAYEYFMGIKDRDELLLQIEEVTDKYYKLETCLKGKALILVNNIPITENNFVLAWDLLEKRYDNKKDLIFNLIQIIINLPNLTIESSTQLLFLVDNACEVIKSLETLGYKLDELSDIIIGKILSDKLDKITKRSWNMTIDSNHIPSSSELLKFLENHAKALNTNETEKGLPLIKCSMKLQENNDALGMTSIHNTTCLMSNQEDSFVLLSTATIMVMNHQGKYQPCRALIDTASQATLITRDCLKKLNLEPSRTRVELAGIGGQILDRPDEVINLNFTSHFNLSKVFKTNSHVVDKVTNYMAYLKFEEHQFHHLQGLQLADPQYQYTVPSLTALFLFIPLGAIKYGHEGQPKAIKTLLGWLLFGEIKIFQKKSRNYQKLHTFNCTLNKWEPIFSLWEEELKTKPDPFEDDFNEIHFKTTHERETTSRYIVRLLFKDPSLLGESKPQAINCFLRMEQILKQQP
ncbi:hypothetical protein LAZ67_11002195 [Cordylochernes scorpioides]|uniref:Peptidase A2 domain-containing protein n=1 Tax=Cordylochernes scorpioides TaxID=51811 RepID=A0ABY6KZ07_9ARAC|nr:hypothetical protein LAZ67_11002195 [Cordylochernes scorpioides]